MGRNTRSKSITRADRRRMVELREETVVQRTLTERLVRSRLQCAGHVERRMTERQRYVRRAGGDEGSQG